MKTNKKGHNMNSDKYTGNLACEFDFGEYCGDFVNGVRHGLGNMTFSNHDLYNGEWENGKMSGNGIYKFWDEKKEKYGQIYEGEFKNGVREGQGKMTYANRDVYIGTWQNDFRTGEGICWFADGSVFHGIWKFDQMIRGVYRKINGEIYDGDLKEGKYHGYGKLFFSNGKWFEGIFENGEFLKGKLFTMEGDVQVINDGIH